MDNPQATGVDIGWLAGIIDGEGWIGISIQHQTKGTYRKDASLSVKLEVKITNCDEAIIDKSMRIMALLGVNAYRRSHKSLGAHRRIVHECSTKNMIGVQTLLTPLVDDLTGNKQERARLMLQFIASRKSNPGVKLENYDAVAGQRGSRTVYPYTAHELVLIKQCRYLQMTGASETTRETREKSLQVLLDQYSDVQARYHGKWAKAATRDDIVQPAVKASGLLS